MADGKDRPTTDSSTLSRSVRERLASQLQFAGFWSAVALPLAYVPMLAGGVAASRPSLFAALLVAHALALVAGHDYHGE